MLMHRFTNQTVTSSRRGTLLGLLWSILAMPTLADGPPKPSDEQVVATAEAQEPEPAPDARETAVALNYCRAAFHRIRKHPTSDVLEEEEEKILNNLNLSRLADPEVVQLYTSVLDEINQIDLAHEERTMYKRNHRSNLSRQLTWDAVALGADLMTAQFGSAIRTGANSWWDYRNLTYKRDTDLFKIEKDRMNSVVRKSSQFLDTFWRLAQKKHIPDRWLVRGDDLDALEAAMREPDAEVRLRILRRMEPFMDAYPPYWYYVGRTQQELGQLPVAIETYKRLETLGQGHFRKDDMLATALANRAAIEDHLGDDTAVVSAESALRYSTDVWEANLICARVLQRRGRVVAAEDAILRNLDVSLETSYSRVFLASLYVHENETAKLAEFLSNPQVVAELPAPLLLRSAAILGPKSTPDPVLRTVVASLQAQPRLQFGNDELLIRASNVWQLHIAQLRVYHGEEALQPVQVISRDGFHDLRFASIHDWGAPVGGNIGDELQFTLEMTYPDKTMLRMTVAGKPLRPSEAPVLFAGTPVTSQPLRIVEVQVDEKRLAFNLADLPAEPFVPVPPASPDTKPTGPIHTEAAKPILERILPIPMPKRTDLPLLPPRAAAPTDVVVE